MTDLAKELRRTRADMLGTDDEEHYWVCHRAADEIERLRELAKNDAKEIGSYRNNTGLRGEIKTLMAEVDWYEYSMRQVQAATSDKAVLAITDRALCDFDGGGQEQ